MFVEVPPAPHGGEEGNAQASSPKSLPTINNEGGYINLSVSELQQHYARCENVILSYCKEGDTFRARFIERVLWMFFHQKTGGGSG